MEGSARPFFHGRPVRGARRGLFWMLIDGVLVCGNFIRRSVPLSLPRGFSLRSLRCRVKGGENN
jgi:hypothetical protein